jgi:uncharacterized glyoxalase superfamily protein PhnB
MAPTVFPVFRYNDARSAIDWLVDAFGFEKHAEYGGPNDTVAHAELRFGPSVIGISSATPPVPGNPWSQARQGVYIAVDDVDAHYERARQAGAEIAMPLRDMDYGSREYTARDPEGLLWAFGSYTMGRGDGSPTLFPAVFYQDPAAVMRFLCDAFGFTTTLEVPDNRGGLLHAELRLGGDCLMIGSRHGSGACVGLTHAVSVYVADPDGHHARARKHGATIRVPLETTPYGARHYAAEDPEGFVWTFGTYRPQ